MMDPVVIVFLLIVGGFLLLFVYMTKCFTNFDCLSSRTTSTISSPAQQPGFVINGRSIQSRSSNGFNTQELGFGYPAAMPVPSYRDQPLSVSHDPPSTILPKFPSDTEATFGNVTHLAPYPPESNRSSGSYSSSHSAPYSVESTGLVPYLPKRNASGSGALYPPEPESSSSNNTALYPPERNVSLAIAPYPPVPYPPESDVVSYTPERSMMGECTAPYPPMATSISAPYPVEGTDLPPRPPKRHKPRASTIMQERSTPPYPSEPNLRDAPYPLEISPYPPEIGGNSSRSRSLGLLSDVPYPLRTPLGMPTSETSRVSLPPDAPELHIVRLPAIRKPNVSSMVEDQPPTYEEALKRHE